MVKLTIVVPCYNEGTRIYRNLIEIITQTEKFCDSFRIIAVNDGSSDETESEIKRAMTQDKRIRLISYPDNKGKGYAVKRGMLVAKSEYVAFLDADLELPPYLLNGFLKKAEGESDNASYSSSDSDVLNGYDIVIGSKMHPDSQVDYPLVRKMLSKGYYTLMKILFGLNIRDTQTGIKLFNTERIRPVLKQMKTNSFSFDVEILAIASKMGLSIEEMPVVVNFSRNKSDKSKIRLMTIFEMFIDAIRIKMQVMKIKKVQA